jgi:cell division protein FtsB
MRSLRPNILAVVLIGVLAFLQYKLWFEAGGIIDMLRMKKQLALQVAQDEKLKKRNEHLVQQIQYLQANKDAVESRARGELGMIKKDETFYQVIK